MGPGFIGKLNILSLLTRRLVSEAQTNAVHCACVHHTLWLLLLMAAVVVLVRGCYELACIVRMHVRTTDRQALP